MFGSRTSFGSVSRSCVLRYYMMTRQCYPYMSCIHERYFVNSIVNRCAAETDLAYL
jgi:hypothetical protein